MEGVIQREIKNSRGWRANSSKSDGAGYGRDKLTEGFLLSLGEIAAARDLIHLLAS